MKTCVLGAGSLGCTIGGMLAKAGADVTPVNRRREQVDAINRNGLLLREGADEHRVRLKAATTTEGLAAMDRSSCWSSRSIRVPPCM